MKTILEQYKIEILNFALKKYVFDYDIDDDFFESIKQDIVSKGNISAKVTLERTELMIKADFELNGTVELICDRTLNNFAHPVKSFDTILYKFSDRDEEFSDTVMLIKENTRYLDLATPIFEFIALNIPLKKIHPDFITDSDRLTDDNILIYTTDKSDTEPTDQNIDILDPRWEALKKLKDTL